MRRSTAWRINVLGPLRVSAGMAVVLRPAQRRLLSILLLEPAGELDRELLMDRMWTDELPPTAKTALHVHISGLRKALPGLVEKTATGYRLTPGRYRCDRDLFDDLARQAVAAARAERWDGAHQTASRALRLWRGPPFDDLRDDDFAAPEVSRLGEVASQLTELQARALMATDRSEEALAKLRELVAQSSLREPAWEQLILGLYLGGRKAEALRTYEEARRILGEELGVEPGAVLRLLRERIEQEDPTLGEAARTLPPHSLPRTETSFVGREEDLGRVRSRLAEHRLVTIVGGPGFGKTRLAIEVGRALVESQGVGAWFVPLSEARNAQGVIAAVAGAVGLRGNIASLTDLVRQLPGRGLLILDNCEHLVGPCSELAGLMLARPVEQHVLATSRQPLGLARESLVRIDPLPLPAAQVVGSASSPTLASAAARLFVDRAREADRSYRFTPETGALVADLCHSTAGIPLALELAASWVPALGLADVGEMLSVEASRVQPDPAQPDHHRSLQATLAWSYALLPAGDRQIFTAASIFKGTFGLEDAVAVCSARRDRRPVATAIARLVDASLLVVERRPTGAVLYRTLLPVREFARARLTRSATWAEVRDRFVNHYLAKARAQSTDLFRAVVDLQAVDDDIDNLRGAFELGLSLGRADEIARALTALDGYFLNRHLAFEEIALLDRVLPLVADPLARAHALRAAGSKAEVTNDLDGSLRSFRQSVEAFQALGDRIGLGRCLLSLAGLHSHRGEWSEGLAAAEEARRLVAGEGNPSALAIAAHYVGENLIGAGRVEEGVAELSAAARLFIESGEVGRASYALGAIGHAAVVTGKDALARSVVPEALALARGSESAYRLVRALSASAAVEARWGDAEVSRAQLLEVDSLLEAAGNEDIFEFLIPAGFLLRRRESWALLDGLLRVVEARLAGTGSGYPVPWQRLARQWQEEAAAGSVNAGSHGPPSSTPGVDSLRAEVVRTLADDSFGAVPAT